MVVYGGKGRETENTIIRVYKMKIYKTFGTLNINNKTENT